MAIAGGADSPWTSIGTVASRLRTLPCLPWTEEQNEDSHRKWLLAYLVDA